MLSILSSVSMWGQSVFEVNGISYRIIKEADESATFGTVHVCSKKNGKYEGNINIPNAIKQGSDKYADSYKVVGIDDEAFANCEDLNSVTLPPSIEILGKRAFSESGIKKISIPYGNLQSISEYAFFSSSLQSISLPKCIQKIEPIAFGQCMELESFSSEGIIEIGIGAFNSCSNLKTVNLPETLLRIGEGAFRDCGFTKIKLPNSLTSIGNSAFSGCDALLSITIPQQITQIEEYTFFLCKKIESIKLPSSLTRIKEGAFSLCDNLSSIEIPGKITEIGDRAFYGCENMKSLYLKTKTPPMLVKLKGKGKETSLFFEDKKPTCKIYVPKESLNSFMSAKVWEPYKDMIEPYSY